MPDSSVSVNFLLPITTPEEIEYFSSLNLESAKHLFAQGDYCWSLQTYLVLRDRGLPVYLSSRFHKDRINIAHARTLQGKWPRPDVFVIDVKADMPYDYWGAQLQIVQNGYSADIRNGRHFIPLWPQAGLIKRDSGRTKVGTFAFAGRQLNLAAKVSEFETMAEKLALEFKLLGSSDWADLSEIDVLIGVRNFDHNRHESKPASKLYNAWHANIPFIGGWDVAFSEIGEPGKAYIRVSSMAELESELSRLTTDNDYYNSFIEAGWQLRVSYSQDSIAKLWEVFLEDIAVPHYLEWQLQSDQAKYYAFAKKFLRNFFTLNAARKMKANVRRYFRSRLAVNR